MATKIRLKRMGKKFYAFYRVVITDSRNKRDGQSIEEIGTYNPNTQPSTIQIDSERAQYWLGVGAQPSEPVLKLLKITGDWRRRRRHAEDRGSRPGRRSSRRSRGSRSPEAEGREVRR